MPKGKNFSCNNTGKRNESDFYQTPYSLTRKFLQRESFDKAKIILEPCCGSGAILKVLKEGGYKCCGYDLLNESTTIKEEG